ncbi:MAG: ASCH domain-containing protein [Patescibacteria group bacterium]
MATTYKVFVKKFLLSSIADGSKDLEVRVGSGFFARIMVGDVIIFNNTCERRVKLIRRYNNFDEMLKKETIARILPGANRQKILSELRQVHGSRDQHRGVIVFELEPL